MPEPRTCRANQRYSAAVAQAHPMIVYTEISTSMFHPSNPAYVPLNDSGDALLSFKVVAAVTSSGVRRVYETALRAFSRHYRCTPCLGFADATDRQIRVFRGGFSTSVVDRPQAISLGQIEGGLAGAIPPKK